MMSKKIIYLIYATAHLLIQKPLIASTNSYYSKTDTSLEEEETFYQKYKTWIIAGCTVAVGGLAVYAYYHNNNKPYNNVLDKMLDYRKCKPKDIAKKISDKVKGNTDAINKLSSILYQYALKVREDMEATTGIALTGGTGTGKSTLMREFWHALNVPGIETGMTNKTTEGYVGDTLSTAILTKLLQYYPDLKNGDAPIAVIGLDEFDKVAEVNGVGRDIKGGDLQNELLKMMDKNGTIIGRLSDRGHRITISTKNMLFVCTGVFANSPPGQLKGIKQELKGRISKTFKLKKLTPEEFVDAQKNVKDSDYKQMQEEFKHLNKNLTINDEALTHLVKYAQKKEGGMRNMKGIMDDVFEYYVDKNQTNCNLSLDEAQNLFPIPEGGDGRDEDNTEPDQQEKNDRSTLEVLQRTNPFLVKAVQTIIERRLRKELDKPTEEVKDHE